MRGTVAKRLRGLARSLGGDRKKYRELKKKYHYYKMRGKKGKYELLAKDSNVVSASTDRSGPGHLESS
jgi:hypothetical protein